VAAASLACLSHGQVGDRAQSCIHGGSVGEGPLDSLLPTAALRL
jgi:hypothetical protein